MPIREGRFELIGVDAVARGGAICSLHEPKEVRVRVACRTDDLRSARAVSHEVEALWLNGPAGGGGVVTSAHEIIAIASTSIPRDAIESSIEILELQL